MIGEIFWYKGAKRFKRLQLTPWTYKIPPLYFLKNEPKPKEAKIIKFETKKIIKDDFNIKGSVNQLF